LAKLRFNSTSSSCIRVAPSSPKTLKSIRYHGITSYNDAATIQEEYVQRYLDFKKAGENDRSVPVVDPALLMFEMSSVYTCGRRQVGKLTEQEKQFLVSPLPNGDQAEFVEAQRGGQLTYHGPGQLVIYPIIDLAKFNVRVKCYVRILEDSIIDTLAAYGIKGFTREDTGVWVNEHEKIASIGIHVRRSITSHGAALNISNDTAWFDRIVACGLPDKKATTMSRQGTRVAMDDVADLFAQNFARRLEITNLEKIDGIVPYFEDR
jgi:lipoyl(octanoyl) transferase